MHLWPSTRIRDSFKAAYLQKLEWNLRKKKVEKQNQQSQRSNQRKLLDGSISCDEGGDEQQGGVDSRDHPCGFALALCRDLFLILSCCFCCGACVDDEES